ncbi:MAG: hypothetical protein LC127_08275 [Chitinophagales bacterium]|nr:hypothetical protein [Chitinophagales bacterium]
MKQQKTYYHIAPVEAIETIKIEGVRCGADKHIYLLTELEAELAPFDITVRIADLLAVSQLGLAEYVLIEIDAKGITSQIKPDLVGESTAAQQKRIRQNLIKPDYIINTM